MCTYAFIYINFWHQFQAPEGIHCVCKRFPFIKIVTSEIDAAVDEEFRVIPGLGDFGDRYFGTDDYRLTIEDGEPPRNWFAFCVIKYAHPLKSKLYNMII